MLMPCGPSAVPTGGAGVALPAGSCRVTTVRIFLATVLYGSFLGGGDATRATRQTVDPGGRGEGGDEHESERPSGRERARTGDNARIGRLGGGRHSFSTWR